MNIECLYCKKEVDARLTSGKEVYPHRKDLYELHFWICDKCGSFVGCHKRKGFTPLGVIATKEIKKARSGIHSILDQIWKKKKYSRNEIYAYLTREIGYEYHTANIRSVEEAEVIFNIIMSKYY